MRLKIYRRFDATPACADAAAPIEIGLDAVHVGNVMGDDGHSR